MIKFRNLRADELEVRVGEKRKDGKMTLLVYKDSRVDMRVLDETVGNDDWAVIYKREGDTLLCGIGIYCEKHKAFIYKWAAGSPSNFEATKGEQSDSLKRAGFVWGIGRSLYSTPKIVVPESNVKFNVSNIEYDEEGKITDLKIVDWNGNVAWEMKDGKVAKVAEQTEEPEIDRLELLKTVCGELKHEEGVDKQNLLKFFNYYETRAESFDKWNARLIQKLWDKWKSR